MNKTKWCNRNEHELGEPQLTRQDKDFTITEQECNKCGLVHQSIRRTDKD